MKTITLIQTVILIMIVSLAKGQNPPENTSTKKTWRGDFQVSVNGGLSFGGTKKDIMSNMSASGFNDPGYRNYFSTKKKPYPYASIWPVFGMGATFYFNRIFGISINTNKIEQVWVDGHDDIGFGNSLTIDSKTKSTSISLALRTLNRSHILTIGPSWITHIESEGSAYYTEEMRSSMWGFSVGYTYLIHRFKHLFMGLKIRYCWASDFWSGPYEKFHWVGAEKYTSVYKQVKVNPSCLNIGISLGLSTYKMN